jgi:hypothetical protein
MSTAAVDQNSFKAGAQRGQRDLFRILLLRKSGSELLVSGEGSPITLPRVQIPKWERVAENVIDAVRKRYGVSALCLFTPEVPSTTTDGEERLYQVMEVKDARAAAPEQTRWLRLSSLLDQSFADAQDFVAITEMLRQLAEFQRGGALGPFARPGWIDELSSWVQSEIEPYGLRLTGKLRQLNASPTFALVRLETNGQAVWFKAVGEPNLREFPISVALSSLLPEFVPAVIAIHSAWHGWLTLESAGSALDEAPGTSAWARAGETLADVQIASIGKTTQLLEAGCRDLRVVSLLALVDPFLEVISRLMKQQRKTSPPVLGRSQLQMLGIQIKAALSAWALLNIPDTLGHLDFNPGNILCSPDRCVFLDWAEAYVGPPILTLEYLRQHLVRLRGEEISLAADVVEPYEKAWRRIVSAEALSAGLDLAPVLAVFAYAAGTRVWQDPTRVREPKTAAYLRSLTRRMRCEVLRPQDRRPLCRR